MTRKNRFRALRNLTITAVLLFAVWLTTGAPIPHQLRAANMHREERRGLLPRSEVVWRSQFDDNRVDTLVGVTPTAVHTYIWNVEAWARSPDGPTLVWLPGYLDYEERTSSLLAVDPPAGAESARLTVTLEIKYGGEWYSEEYREEGVRDGECFLFVLTCHHLETADPLTEPEYVALTWWKNKCHEEGYFATPYTLEFFDGEGNLILSCANQA